MSKPKTVTTPPAGILATRASSSSVDLHAATTTPTHVSSVSTTIDNAEKGGEDGQEEKKDTNVVDFDGPHDPECAMNWSPRKKWSSIACLSFMTFVTYVRKIVSMFFAL